MIETAHFARLAQIAGSCLFSGTASGVLYKRLNTPLCTVPSVRFKIFLSNTQERAMEVKHPELTVKLGGVLP